MAQNRAFHQGLHCLLNDNNFRGQKYILTLKVPAKNASEKLSAYVVSCTYLLTSLTNVRIEYRGKHC